MKVSDNKEKQEKKNPGESDESRVDPLYEMLKPLHNLPRGKNAWNPQFIRHRLFWPLSVAFLIVLSYVYPYLQKIVFGD